MDLSAPLSVVTAAVDGDVLAVLAELHEPFTGRQIHQLVGQHSERGVRNTLNRLADQGIVSRERSGAADLFGLNRSHLAAPYVVALANLRHEFHLRLCAELQGWDGSVHAVLVEATTDGVLLRVGLAAGADVHAQRGRADQVAERVAGWLGNVVTVEVTDQPLELGTGTMLEVQPR